MITPERINAFIQALSSLIAIVAITRLSKPISDFILSESVVFMVSGLYFFNSTDNAIRSVIYAFLTVIVLKTLTVVEAFDLITPTPNSSINCLKVTKDELVKSFGDEKKLKVAMIDSGVPLNMKLDDFNAPEIATYLANNPVYASVGPCKLIV